MFELINRFLFGVGIASIIYFLPLSVEVNNSSLTVKTELTSPVTDDVFLLVQEDYNFRVKYYCSIIVNRKKVYKESYIKELSYKGKWLIDGNEVNKKDIQKDFGSISFDFKETILKEGDKLTLFIKAQIVDDVVFQKSTGLKPSILWEEYEPSINEKYRYIDGSLIKE